MITEYFRPESLEQALSMLARPDARPLGGGTVLNRGGPGSYAVVDLQGLGLDGLRRAGGKLVIGATCRLQTLLEAEEAPPALKTALRLEAPLNLRNAGTAAGALVSCDGRSPFATLLLALDARLTLAGGDSPAPLSLGDLLPVRAEALRGRLITAIEIPLEVRLAYEQVARTPADRPIVCAALARWPSGRTRLVLGGWGPAPSLALDGNEPGGVEAAAREAAHDAGDDWASAEYRRAVAAELAKRCLDG